MNIVCRALILGMLLVGSLLGVLRTSPAHAAAIDLFNNTNGYTVYNNPPAWTLFTLPLPAYITKVENYHYNNGAGAIPGSIGLQVFTPYGPGATLWFATVGAGGRSGTAPYDWIATVNRTLPAGRYRVLDSNYASWSNNAQSKGQGFSIVRSPYPLPSTTIFNHNSNDCLGISGNSTSQNAYADQYPCVGAPSQFWSLLPQSNGLFSIVNNNSNDCLGISGNSTSQNAYADQYPCVGAPSQSWSF
jgi:Ricin-type beta-trefoil lectin domain-like